MYRETTQPPPICPLCNQPAVIAEPLHGILLCPEYHAFDWPKDFGGCGLPGMAGLHACSSCGATAWTWRLVTPTWRQRLRGEETRALIVCTCGAPFEAGCSTCGARHDQDCDSGRHS